MARSEDEQAGGRGDSIQVISRAAAILRALAGQPDGLSLGQIARRVELPRSTVQRIVAALREERLVSVGEGVRLGPTLALLAAAAQTDLVSVAQPHLEALSRRVQETVNLSLLQGERAVCVARSLADQELSVRGSVGDAFPLHCTAHGKALLARMTDEDVARLVGARLVPLTARTVRSLPALLEELRAVRERGVAFGLEEHAEGICAVGTALRLEGGPRYTLSIPVPTSRFELRRDVLCAELLRGRDALEAAVGRLAAPG